MTVIPHDDMITYFNLEQLSGADKVTSHLDISR